MKYENIYFDKDTIFLVTGGAGFIGSNLCEAILELGYKVRCFDNFSTGKIENIKYLQNNPMFELIEGDIRDYDMCFDICNGVDFVLHQAAWGSVSKSIEMPLLYEDINVKGTLNILEAARQQRVKKFVYASSAAVYGDGLILPKKEGKEGNLLSPYALTKRINEDYAKLYSEIYGLDTYGLRYFNVFGKRQDQNGIYASVVPKFIYQLLKNETPIIYGDGTQSRDFVYIKDIIQANLKACGSSSEFAGQAYNIASGNCICLNDVCNYLGEIFHKKFIPEFQDIRKGDIKYSWADISKAKSILKYNPQWTFEAGINDSLQWYIDMENEL